jgi:hypothetical protein
MNPFYTDETKIIMLNSANRISGRDSDSVLNMGYHLNNDYLFYHCQVIDFYGNSMNVEGERLANFDAFDFMESSYNSHNKYNGQTIVCGVVLHGARQYRLTQINNRFIVKNFNGKNIRFAITKGNGEYKGVDFSGIRDWTLLMAFTPIKNTLEPIYYISSKKNESFTYCFNGLDRTNLSDPIDNCNILLKPISSAYTEFFVDVKIIQHTHPLQTVGPEYLNIFISGWSEDYPQRQFIGCLFCAGSAPGTNVFDSNKGSDNAVFKVKHMTQPRVIKLELLRTDYASPGAAFLEGYNIHFSCLITPIR